MAEKEIKRVKTFWDRESVKISDWGESSTKSEYAADAIVTGKHCS